MSTTWFKDSMLSFLVIMISIALFACGGEEVSEPEDSAELEIEVPVEETPSENQKGSVEYDNYDQIGSTYELPKITSISILTQSNNLRDGFKAQVQTEDNDSGDVDFLYQWNHNGKAIAGETGSAVTWQDEFKKGDNLSVSVVPVNAVGEGVWAAEGGIVIPNSPPVIISEPGDLFDTGEFSYTVQAEDPDGDSFDYTLRGAPKGMTIEPATGLITWEYGVEDAGEYEVLIIATDSEGAETTQTLSFNIHSEVEAP